MKLNIFLKKYQNKIRGKSITHNIFRMQGNESVMREFYCIASIENILSRKTLLDFF